MKKLRIIPIIILKDGQIVQSYNFERYKDTGNAFKTVERFSQWDADEMIYLDISSSHDWSTKRSDLNSIEIPGKEDLIVEIAKRSTMPLTFGGGLRTTKEIEKTISLGADKVSVNTLLFENTRVVKEAVKSLGAQAIVASVDYRVLNGKKLVWNPISRTVTENEICDWVRRVEDLGVGELLLTCADRDGAKVGYDLETLEDICHLISLPVIANGGVGNWGHLEEGFRTGVSAVAAANIFHFYDQSVYLAKSALFDAGLPVRKPSLAIKV